MKRSVLKITLVIALVLGMFPTMAFAAYTPPASYGAPQNAGVSFDSLGFVNGDGLWGFNIGCSASDEIRALVEADEDGTLEDSGYDSLNILVQWDYKLDDGTWRSELPGYDEWINPSITNFSAKNGEWTASCNATEADFKELFPDTVLPGGKAYFDNHTMYFRVRFWVDFYGSDKHYEYFSPWSSEVSYSNNQKVYDPAALINHAPKLISAELKKDTNGKPYLAFTADKAHSDVQLLNSISEQCVFTDVWVRVNGGEWVDTGGYFWLKEQFNIDASDYFKNVDNYEAAVYEVKFRYSFDYQYYPQAGKSGSIYSPFSNVVSHGMPAYEGASSWAVPVLDRANEYGFITDRIKSNMAGKITREEFAEIAVKLYEKYTGKTAEVGDAYFTDTTNPEILKAANLKMVAGVGNNKYAPNELVTREQMTTILFQALRVINPTANFSTADVSKFADDNIVEKWARQGVYYCFKAKIINGIGNNMFDPAGNATREQAVIVCTKAYELFQK